MADIDLTGFDVHPRRGAEGPFATGLFDLARHGCPRPGEQISMRLDGELLTGIVADDGSVTMRPPMADEPRFINRVPPRD